MMRTATPKPTVKIDTNRHGVTYEVADTTNPYSPIHPSMLTETHGK